MKWKKGISNLLSNRNEKFLNSEVIKEKLERLKDIYFSFKLVSRYLDSKTLFDLLSVCNDKPSEVI